MTYPHPLSCDPGRTPAPLLLARFLAMDLRAARGRLARTFGLKALRDAVPADHAPPDSGLCRAARDWVAAVSPPYLLNHAERTYCFGAILAARDGLRFDREVFYLASILHDIALTPPIEYEPGSFEWNGARHGRRFCLSRGMDERRADLVHDAIALHAAVGIAHKRQAEITLVHLGAGVDVIGLRFDDIPKDALQRVLGEFPRLDMKRCFTERLVREAVQKPRSHIAGHVGLGFARKMAAAPFAA